MDASEPLTFRAFEVVVLCVLARRRVRVGAIRELTFGVDQSVGPGHDQRVVVQTELAPSNDNLTIRISDTCGVGEAGTKAPLGEAGRELGGQREFVVHGS